MAAILEASPAPVPGGSAVVWTVMSCWCRAASTSSASKSSDCQRTTWCASFCCARCVIYATASGAECTCATTPPAASNSCCTCASNAGRCAARRVWSWAAALATSVSLHHKDGRDGGGTASLCKARRTRAKNASWLLMHHAFFWSGTVRHGPFMLQGLLPALAKGPCCHRFEIPRLGPASKRRRQPGEPALLHERLLRQGR